MIDEIRKIVKPCLQYLLDGDIDAMLPQNAIHIALFDFQNNQVDKNHA